MGDLTWIPAPFGGNVVQFSVDFRQILPTINGDSRVQIIHAYVNKSPLYSQFQTLLLTDNMRLMAPRNAAYASADTLSFPDFLLALGEGFVPYDEEERASLSSSIASQSDLLSFCRAIFYDHEEQLHG